VASLAAPNTAQRSTHRPSARITTLTLLALTTALGVGAALLPLWVMSVGGVLAVVTIAVLTSPLAVLALLLVLAPLRTLYATEAPRLGYPTIPLDIGQWLVLAFLVSWVIHLLRSKRLPFFIQLSETRTLAPLIPLALFVAAAGLSGFTALSLTAWLTEWSKWLQIALIALITVDLVRQHNRQRVVDLLILAGCANALIGIYQYFGGSGALHLLINERNFRSFGTFGQPNPFGGFMGILFPLAFASGCAALLASYNALKLRHYIRLRITLVKVVVYGAAAALMAVALYMSWSRGAWLGFGVALAVMIFALPRRFLHSLLLALVVAILGGALLTSGRLPASLTARLATITQDIFDVQDVRGVDIDPANYAVIERLAHWQAAINMATESPWLGVGLGNYEVAYAQHRLINWKFALGHAHNMYLNMLAESGFIGLVTYAAFIFATLWYAWRVRQHPDYRARLLAVGILGVWTYMIVHSLTDNLYVNNMFIHLSVTIGLLTSLLRDVSVKATR
jgi:putative inorganic carbon (hco3(-)) transporter